MKKGLLIAAVIGVIILLLVGVGSLWADAVSLPKSQEVNLDGGPAEFIVVSIAFGVSEEKALELYNSGIYRSEPYEPGEIVYWFGEYPYMVRGDTFYLTFYYYWLLPEVHWEELRNATDFDLLVPGGPILGWDWATQQEINRVG